MIWARLFSVVTPAHDRKVPTRPPPVLCRAGTLLEEEVRDGGEPFVQETTEVGAIMRRLVGVLFWTAWLAVAIPVAVASEQAARADAPTVLTAQRGLLPQVTRTDEITIILVGTALIGLAALVRRTS
jgi:hypothetical protein